jgi:hypothetical protein
MEYRESFRKCQAKTLTAPKFWDYPARKENPLIEFDHRSGTLV